MTARPHKYIESRKINIKWKMILDEALIRHKPRNSLKLNLVLGNDLMLGWKVHEKICKTFIGLEIFPQLRRNKDHNCKTLYMDISNKLHYLLKISMGPRDLGTDIEWIVMAFFRPRPLL